MDLATLRDLAVPAIKVCHSSGFARRSAYNRVLSSLCALAVDMDEWEESLQTLVDEVYAPPTQPTQPNRQIDMFANECEGICGV